MAWFGGLKQCVQNNIRQSTSLRRRVDDAEDADLLSTDLRVHADVAYAGAASPGRAAVIALATRAWGDGYEHVMRQALPHLEAGAPSAVRCAVGHALTAFAGADEYDTRIMAHGARARARIGRHGVLPCLVGRVCVGRGCGGGACSTASARDVPAHRLAHWCRARGAGRRGLGGRVKGGFVRVFTLFLVL